MVDGSHTTLLGLLAGCRSVLAVGILLAPAGLARAGQQRSERPELHPINGVLRVHPTNPRYFTDRSGKAIYLAGHQCFVDLQDNPFNMTFTRGPARTLNWPAYLDFLTEHRFNYVRNWVVWSTGSGAQAPQNRAVACPLPYRRVEGRGTACDGGNRFDLTQFDEEFFTRLRRRCEDLQQRGVYVSIMLFDVYGFLDGEPQGTPAQTLWDGNVFHEANNVNGIDTDSNGDGKGIEFFYTSDESVLALQKAYVSKVLDTLNHLDNVFFEIVNELHAPEWQYDMIRFVQQYELGKPKQHLVLMSPGGRTRLGRWQQLSRQVLLDSPADCYAVAGSWQARAFRQQNPPANNTGKPAIVDMDHVSAGSSDVGFVWSAFTRGYHFNLYDKPFESPDVEGADWQRVRQNVGQTIEYAQRLDLARAAPREDLASTGFCLACPGQSYVIFVPEGGAVSLDLASTPVRFRAEWYDPLRTTRVPAAAVDGGARRQFTPPFRGPAVLFLERASGK